LVAMTQESTKALVAMAQVAVVAGALASNAMAACHHLVGHLRNGPLT